MFINVYVDTYICVYLYDNILFFNHTQHSRGDIGTLPLSIWKCSCVEIWNRNLCIIIANFIMYYFMYVAHFDSKYVYFTLFLIYEQVYASKSSANRNNCLQIELKFHIPFIIDFIHITWLKPDQHSMVSLNELYI